MELALALETAIDAARAAGRLLLADFHRPEGPRGAVDKADADTEAELLIRQRLLAAFPAWSFRGEETGVQAGEDGQPTWLVDPNDGTRDYLVGRRGSAVSIGLAHEGRPVLGVIFAFAHPDDDGDLFTWAEGCGPVRRNGQPVEPALPDRLLARHVVLVSSGGERNVEANLRWLHPARFRAVPSIAHRLALVAAGEADAATSLFAPGAWDYAAGHALLRGSGAVLLDEEGREVRYGPLGESQSERAFGALAPLAEDLALRSFESARQGSAPAELKPGQALTDPGLLARAQGCLFGQVAGDSLGGLVEFRSAGAIARSYPDGPRVLEDGGTWNILAGQPTDDSELALALARSIVSAGRYDADAALQAYQGWRGSAPFDVGGTIGAALSGQPNPASQANGSLMRISPLAIFGHAMDPAVLASLARADSELTHPSPVCGDAVAAFAVAVASAVAAPRTPAELHATALSTATLSPVREVLERAVTEAPTCDGGSQGWVLIALQNAFFELLHAASLEEGLVRTVRRGGDTDTNAAIAGALLGAAHGREAVPAQWRKMVLSCHAHPLRAVRPRPREYWPSDLPVLAELLLLAGRQVVG